MLLNAFTIFNTITKESEGGKRSSFASKQDEEEEEEEEEREREEGLVSFSRNVLFAYPPIPPKGHPSSREKRDKLLVQIGLLQSLHAFTTSYFPSSTPDDDDNDLVDGDDLDLNDPLIPLEQNNNSGILLHRLSVNSGNLGNGGSSTGLHLGTTGSPSNNDKSKKQLIFRSKLYTTALVRVEGLYYWMALTVKNNLDVKESHNNHLGEILIKIIEKAYDRFRLFHHSFFHLSFSRRGSTSTSFATNGGLGNVGNGGSSTDQTFKESLQDFWENYVPVLSKDCGGEANLVSSAFFDGIKYFLADSSSSFESHGNESVNNSPYSSSSNVNHIGSNNRRPSTSSSTSGRQQVPLPFQTISPQAHLNSQILLACKRLVTFLPLLSNTPLILLYKDTLAYTTLQSYKDIHLLYKWLTCKFTGIHGGDGGFVNQVKEKGQSLVFDLDAEVEERVGESSEVGISNGFFKKSKKKANRTVIKPFSGFLVGPDLTGIPTHRKYEPSSTTNNSSGNSTPLLKLCTPKLIHLCDGSPHNIIVYQWLQDWTFCLLPPPTSSSTISGNQEQSQQGDLSNVGWYILLESCIDRVLRPVHEAYLATQKRKRRPSIIGDGQNNLEFFYNYVSINYMNLHLYSRLAKQRSTTQTSGMATSAVITHQQKLLNLLMDLKSSSSNSGGAIRELVLQVQDPYTLTSTSGSTTSLSSTAWIYAERKRVGMQQICLSLRTEGGDLRNLQADIDRILFSHGPSSF